MEVTPERRTDLIDIEIKVTNITSTAGAPRTHLTAMCEGMNMETATRYGNSVTHEFVLNNKRVDPDNYRVGTISKKLIAFGPELKNDAYVNKHRLVMHFVLVNGCLLYTSSFLYIMINKQRYEKSGQFFESRE